MPRQRQFAFFLDLLHNAVRLQVLRLVLREGAALVICGTLFGFLGAIALAKIVSALANIFVDALGIGMTDLRLLAGAPIAARGGSTARLLCSGAQGRQNPTSQSATPRIRITLQKAERNWVAGEWQSSDRLMATWMNRRLFVLVPRLLHLRSRLDADAVVDCVLDSLLAPEILLRRLHRNMSKQKLDLVQFTTSNMA